MKELALFCLIPVIAVGLPSQTTHLVGPGGLPQIHDALAVAAPGDTLLVQPGTYAHFTCAVGVTIRAQVPGSVAVVYDPAFAPPGCLNDFFCANLQGPTWFSPPTGQTVHVVGVDFEPTVVPGPTIVRHRVVVSSGRVTFDHCTLRADFRTALSVQDAALHLQDCALQNLNGTGFALYAIRAHVTATGTEFVGGDAALSTPPDAVQLYDARFVGSHLTLRGGDTFLTADGRALYASNSDVWIADSTLTSVAGTCPLVTTYSTGRIARSVLLPTMGAGGYLCASGPVLPSGPVLGVERMGPLQNGTTFTMNVRTEPNTLVAVHASNGLGTVQVPGVFEQPIALDLSAFWLAGVYASDANGDVSASWNLPAGMFLGEPLWLETIAFVPSLPIQVGPVVGGIIR
jgi:hypothetical protein